jgi:hypothetical protein
MWHEMVRALYEIIGCKMVLRWWYEISVMQWNKTNAQEITIVVQSINAVLS